MSELHASPRPDAVSAVATDELAQIDTLLPTVYEELHQLAAAVLQRCRPTNSAHTTSLIHDAYMRLAVRGIKFRDRAHFLNVAARAMRFVLVDRARRNGAAKRGSGQTVLTLYDTPSPAIDDSLMLAVEDALTRLAAFDERRSRIVELRFFGGLSVEETGEVLGISPATVKREWSLARAWLSREIGDGEESRR